MFLGRCRTRNEADILINVFTQVISGSSSVVQWQTIFSAFPDFYFCLSRPYHIIVNDSHAQAWVSVSVRISFHSRIIPVERCSILHFESIYQVLSRTSRSFTAFYSHREISFFEIAMLTGRTRQNNFNALVIGCTKQVREFIQLISISGNEFVSGACGCFPFSVIIGSEKRTCHIQCYPRLQSHSGTTCNTSCLFIYEALIVNRQQSSQIRTFVNDKFGNLLERRRLHCVSLIQRQHIQHERYIVITLNQFKIIECTEETNFISVISEVLYHILISIRVFPIFEILTFRFLKVKVSRTYSLIIETPDIVNKTIGRPCTVYKSPYSRRFIYMNSVVGSSIQHCICS
ncbi:unknown [Bacteroides sp. CAG:530]|nr:unknown [Bacteroides sp. CAG:530]